MLPAEAPPHQPDAAAAAGQVAADWQSVRTGLLLNVVGLTVALAGLLLALGLAVQADAAGACV